MISRNCRIALLAVCLTLLLCGGALAASLTIHAPEEAKQGSAVKVRVVIDEQLPQLTFTWLGKNIAAPTVADGGHRIAEALLPVPVNADKDLIVQATAGTLTGKAIVKVLKVKWPEQQISVKKTFVNPPKEAMKRIDAERKKSSEAINRVTPERYWRGEFQRPVPTIAASICAARKARRSRPWPTARWPSLKTCILRGIPSTSIMGRASSAPMRTCPASM